MDVALEARKAQKGDARAFEQLIQAHKVVMYRVAKTMLSSDSDCSDAIQEAILKAFMSIKTLREPVYFKTWLLRILINACQHIRRQHQKVVEIQEYTDPPSKEIGYEEVELQQLLETLPKEDRDLLKLYHVEDLSIKELADIYQKPENTIKTRLRRARELARQIWGEQEGYPWKNGSRN